MASTLFSTAPVIGDAPYAMARSADQSRSAAPGTAQRNCSTAGTRKALVTPSCSMVSSSASGTMSATSTMRAPNESPTSAKPDPPMWNSGIATIATDWVSMPQCPPTESSAAKFACESSTPLAIPVVPEV